MELIDKCAVVSEIKRYLECVEKRLDRNNRFNDDAFIAWERDTALYNVYHRILSFIDDLEINDVCRDIENEVDKWYNNEASKEFEQVLYSDIEKCAKHFYELGILAGTKINQQSLKNE